ncbi:hypothetical protein BH23ACT9_BH23ACT9_05640 [soil metagenome]
MVITLESPNLRPEARTTVGICRTSGIGPDGHPGGQFGPDSPRRVRPVGLASGPRVGQALACAPWRAGLSCKAALGSFSSALALTPSATRSPSALSTLRQ